MSLPPDSRQNLDARAEAAGIQLSYEAADGRICAASETAKRELLAALGGNAGVPAESQPPGPEPGQDPVQDPVQDPGQDPVQERLREAGGAEIGTPCYMPSWMAAGRCFGITCQLYGLRSERNAGIGDFADLARLGELAANEGADFIGVSPLHALFSADPARYSPYSPSSRRFLNPLYIAIDWIDDSCAVKGHTDDETGAGWRAAALIDYEAVASRKMAALRRLFAHFMERDYRPESDAGTAFSHFFDDGGPALRDFSRFETLSELCASGDSGTAAAGWFDWPAELKDKDSRAVAALCADHEDDVLFHAWLQWIASQQLAHVQEHLHQAGMRIGLYLDIAVGVAPDGAETWCEAEATIAAARIGAPPDPFNSKGQNWGLAPLAPQALAKAESRLFRDTLEQCMQQAGAVRLDHVMALERLFLIPEGRSPLDGAYVCYPQQKLIAETAEVSRDTETIVIGEDLGTVRPAFRETLKAMELQSYRVLPFERSEEGGFKPPADWPNAALACAATHDLATLHGWWGGTDLAAGAAIGELDEGERSELEAVRQQDRDLLLAALEAEGLTPAHIHGSGEIDSNALAVAVHIFLARTPCRLLAIQLEDLLSVRDQANMPGTIDEHPNWRRKMPLNVDDVVKASLWAPIFNAVRNERPPQR